MRNDARFDIIQTLIKIAINIDDKLYKRAIKKRYDQLHERARIFFELTIEYYAKRDHSKKYNNLNYRESTSMKLDST